MSSSRPSGKRMEILLLIGVQGGIRMGCREKDQGRRGQEMG